MKILLLIIILLLPASGRCLDRDFGAGLIVGNTMGIDAKYWITSTNAVEGVFSAFEKNDPYFHLDYLWHDYTAFPQPERGKLPLFYGLGVKINTFNNFGIRLPIGLDYIVDNYPFDVFFELAPVINLNPDVRLNLSGGLGARYYFGFNGKKKK